MKKVLFIGIVALTFIINGCALKCAGISFTNSAVPIDCQIDHKKEGTPEIFILDDSVSIIRSKIIRVLTEGGFITDSDDKAGIITTNFILLGTDESFTGAGILIDQYGSLRFILTEKDSGTEIKIYGYISDYWELPYCHPLIQKYSQLIQEKPLCPCHYYTGECENLDAKQQAPQD